jgi:uncharacterized membrane protein YjfL (UPF0719 family)
MLTEIFVRAARGAAWALVGIVIYGAALALITRSAPTAFTQQISRERNIATAVLFAGFSLAIAAVLAATIRGS